LRREPAHPHLLQTLFMHDVVDGCAFVDGAPVATRAAPRSKLTCDPYCSAGMRVVTAPEREKRPK
jgi:hypothetical protein